MKLAFSKPTAGDDEQRLLFTQFRAAGFDGLQLKSGQFSRYVDQPQRFLEEWGGPEGATSALITGGRLDDAGIAALRRLFGFARAVGAERVVFCLSVPRQGLTSQDIRGFARTLSELGKESEQQDIKLSLHHHYDQPVMYRQDFDVFFDAVPGGAVGLTVDTAHLVKSGIEDVAAVIRDFGRMIDNLHMKDFAGGKFQVLGQGRIDFAPVFSALRETGYAGWICADEESGSDTLEAMTACHRFLKAGLP
jgi:sugar phosphate isomerase/epimerase